MRERGPAGPNRMPEDVKEWGRAGPGRRPPIPPQAESFHDHELPNARRGIEAKDTNGRTIWLTRAISHSIYGCPCCRGLIEIGHEHAFVRIQSGTRFYDHHHLHKVCSYTWIDFDRPYVIFKIDGKSDKKINKRQARARYRASRRRRGLSG